MYPLSKVGCMLERLYCVVSALLKFLQSSSSSRACFYFYIPTLNDTLCFKEKGENIILWKAVCVNGCYYSAVSL